MGVVSWQATEVVDQLPYDLVKPLAFRVLLKLANVADPEGRRAWRSKFELANELGVDQRSIQRALRELEQAHLIRKGDQKFVTHIRAGYRPTVYDIVMRRPGDHGMQPLDDGMEEVETRGDTVIHNPVRGDTRGDTDSSTEELKNHLLNTQEESLDPAAREHEALRSRCAPPFKAHEFVGGICIHGCGVYADGRVEDPRTGLTILEAVPR
ncbi:MAG: hypothetical protein BGO94_14745 [Micrococcales bacterium 72-143]|nr:MAG: hypothetical protein BGO94_14745 [Micrococcales bacterium 72-143]